MLEPCTHRARLTHESASRVTVEQGVGQVVVTVWRGDRLREGIYRVSGRLVGLVAGGDCGVAARSNGYSVEVKGRNVVVEIRVGMCEAGAATVKVGVEC